MSCLSRSVGRRLLVGVTAFALFATAFGTLHSAQLTKPSAKDHQVSIAVSSLLQREHLLRLNSPPDSEMSERCLKTFMQDLDPFKMYFNQSDYDEFAQDKDRLAELIRKGNIDFAYKVFNRYLERIDDRVKIVDKILATPQDYTIDEVLATDKDKTTYAKTPEEAHEKWRKWIKRELLVLKDEKTDGKPDKSEGKTPEQRLTQRYHSLAKRTRQTDGDELLELYLTSLTMAYDPHTTYMSPSSVENFKIMMQLKLEGIGASLQATDGYTVVKKIIPGGAAEKEKSLKIDDKIIAVGEGESGELVDVVDMKLNDVVKMIRGKPGTVVRLQVTSVKDPKPHEIKITRAEIELKDSEAQQKIFEYGHRPDGKPYKVGVINLPSFYMDMDGARAGNPNYKSTTRDVRHILKEFKEQGVDGVVLDLRSNGGGSLTEAISLTGLFINEGPVVQVKDADGRVTSYIDPDPSIEWGGPLVVVISKFSASASEIFAGAIQDYNRGLIVGDKSTHGKGTVQSLLNLGEQLFRIPNAPKLGELKITMQQFYRPGGDSTQRRGVVSDVELPSVITHMDVGEADLDYSLPFDQVPTQEFKKFDLTSPAMIDQLRRTSAARCAASDKFQKVERNIVRYMERKARKTETLNEAKYLKERADSDSDKEEDKAIEKLSENPSGIERDFYLDEVFNILGDYMSHTQVVKAG